MLYHKHFALLPGSHSAPRHDALTALSTHSASVRVVSASDIHLGSRSLVSPRAIYQALLDIGGERVECLVDIDVALS